MTQTLDGASNHETSRLFFRTSAAAPNPYGCDWQYERSKPRGRDLTPVPIHQAQSQVQALFTENEKSGDDYAALSRSSPSRRINPKSHGLCPTQRTHFFGQRLSPNTTPQAISLRSRYGRRIPAGWYRVKVLLLALRRCVLSHSLWGVSFPC